MVRLDSDGKYTPLRLGPLAQRVDPTVEVDAADAVRVRRRTAAPCSGMQPSAVAPTSAPSGSTGTSRQPRTCSPSSSAMASTCSRAVGAGGGVLRQEADACGEGVGAVGGAAAGSSKSTTSRRSSTGSWMRMPAPSPLLGSAPAAPRCSRCSRAIEPVGDDGVRAPALDVGDHGDAAGVRLVLRVVQALGVSGNAENSIGEYLRSPGNLRPGLQRPDCRLYQRSSATTRREASGPAGTRADFAPPSR